MIALPFSAIVGQEEMKLALILNGINPNLGGVLILGPKGSAKSSAARALAQILPPLQVNANCAYLCDPTEPCGHCHETRAEERPTPFVSLPLGATEDRVLGSIDLEQALRRGEKHFEPGLLAHAHRGILYVDEVNLLPDHLVDILLDVAASGENLVEREGISVRHPARFIPVATMNPEEGELRPQLLDRFALSVQAENLNDPQQRAEAVRRSLEFESDRGSFAQRWRGEEDCLGQRIREARRRLPEVQLTDEVAWEISDLCCRENVEGLRADIVIRKAAIAFAAWQGRSGVTPEDVARVAEYALAHRRCSPPQPPAPPPPPLKAQRPQSAKPDGGTVFQPMPQGTVRNPENRFKPRPVRPGHGAGRAPSARTRGAYLRARLPQGRVSDLAFAATVGAAAINGRPQEGELVIAVRPEDLREKVRRIAHQRLFLFVLDASRSMGARQRMEWTKGVLIGLLEDAYQRRNTVGLITFQGEQATLALPPTRSVRRVQREVRELAIGGRTPLAHGLVLAEQVVQRVRRRQGRLVPSVVLISDGRPTLGLAGREPVGSAEQALERLVRSDLDILLVDTEEGLPHLGMMAEWAARWGAPLVRLSDLRADRIRSLLRVA